MDTDVEMAVVCPVCQGEVYLLGVLGRLVWYRCQDCGIEFPRERGETHEVV